MCYLRSCCVLLGLAAASDPGWPAESPAADDMRTAIERAVPLLEAGLRGATEQRECFMCHHHAVGLIALQSARQRGFGIDNENFEQQVRHVADFLKRGKSRYEQGRGQGGRAITAGYALWTLDISGYEPDETTAAVGRYLVDYQHSAGHWSHPGSRPPSSGSDFTTTYVSARGLEHYAGEAQSDAVSERFAAVREWLLTATPNDTEDRVFRLRLFALMDQDEQQLRAALDELLSSQHEEGGWSQNEELAADAYATGTVLAALLEYELIPRDHPAVRRGVRFLLDAQRDDGSWHVVSRANPFQDYFESGFPHGSDQFISMAASGWAVYALTLALPESSRD